MKKTILFILLLLPVLSFSQTIHTLTLRSKPSNSSFANIDSSPADSITNFKGSDIVIADWTGLGIPYIWRSLLKFDFSTLPAGSVIDSAHLSLYADTASIFGNPGYPTFGTDNAVGIYRLTSAWDTTTVTWPTQPSYTPLDSAILTQSISTGENYLNINITSLAKDAYAFGNYGFLFKPLQEIVHYNSMIFYSPYQYATDSTVTPRLVLKYHTPLAVNNVSNAQRSFNVYPNPSSGDVTFNISKNTEDHVTIKILDLTGKNIAYSERNDNKKQLNVSYQLSDYPNGLYFATISFNDGNTITCKFIINH